MLRLHFLSGYQDEYLEIKIAQTLCCFYVVDSKMFLRATFKLLLGKTSRCLIQLLYKVSENIFLVQTDLRFPNTENKQGIKGGGAHLTIHHIHKITMGELIAMQHISVTLYDVFKEQVIWNRKDSWLYFNSKVYCPG